jgi:hypothetical protein
MMLVLNVHTFIPSAKVDFATSITLGAYFLLALHKEHMTKKNIVLDIPSKRPVSPKCVNPKILWLMAILGAYRSLASLRWCKIISFPSKRRLAKTISPQKRAFSPSFSRASRQEAPSVAMSLIIP